MNWPLPRPTTMWLMPLMESVPKAGMVSDELVRVTVSESPCSSGSFSISQSFGPPEMMSLPPPPLIVLDRCRRRSSRCPGRRR